MDLEKYREYLEQQFKQVETSFALPVSERKEVRTWLEGGYEDLLRAEMRLIPAIKEETGAELPFLGKNVTQPEAPNTTTLSKPASSGFDSSADVVQELTGSGSDTFDKVTTSAGPLTGLSDAPANPNPTIRPGPYSVAAYYQDGQFYKHLDHVNQYSDWYEIRSNGAIELVETDNLRGAGSLVTGALGAVSDLSNTVTENIWEFFSGSDQTVSGSAFAGTDGDRLAGDPSEALDIAPPEALKIIREGLFEYYGEFSGRLDGMGMMERLLTTRDHLASLPDGVTDEHFLAEQRQILANSGAKFTREQDPDHEFTAGQPGVPSTTDRKRARDADGNFLVDVSDTGEGTFADDASGLGSGNKTPGDVVANLPPGEGPHGQVTGELLKEFVNSDFSLTFNAVLNGFRDAGGAAIFLDWFSNQYNRFRGEYQGIVANEALEGNIPTTSFTDFWERKGLMEGDGISDGPIAAFSDFAERQSPSSASAGNGAPAQAALPPNTAAAAPSAGDTLPSDQDVVAELTGGAFG